MFVQKTKQKIVYVFNKRSQLHLLDKLLLETSQVTVDPLKKPKWHDEHNQSNNT